MRLLFIFCCRENERTFVSEVLVSFYNSKGSLISFPLKDPSWFSYLFIFFPKIPSNLNHVRLGSPTFILNFFFFCMFFVLLHFTESNSEHKLDIISHQAFGVLARLIVGDCFLSNGASLGLCEPSLGESEEEEEEDDWALQGTVKQRNFVLSCSFSLARGCPGSHTGPKRFYLL